MVRLHVRKSLLSAWTSSRLYARRRRCVHRRTAACYAAAAAGDDGGRDIRLDVLLFSCCCSSDSISCCCCCCCMTDEECQGNLPAPSSFLYVLLLCECFRPDAAHASPRALFDASGNCLPISADACFLVTTHCAHTCNDDDVGQVITMILKNNLN